MFDLVAIIIGKSVIYLSSIVAVVAIASFCLDYIYKKGKHGKYFIEYMLNRNISPK